jgi:hypothetical protein
MCQYCSFGPLQHLVHGNVTFQMFFCSPDVFLAHNQLVWYLLDG